MSRTLIKSKDLGTRLLAGVPDEIQWMPPGEHKIRATKDGKPIELDVRVNAAGAERVQAALREMLAAAERGEGDLPYFDFNHDDNRASGYPTEAYWAGEDPREGGIRMKVEWTGSGEASLKGRDFRRFSPGFFVNESGEIIGAPINMGALVNRAAFRKIAPIVAGEPVAEGHRQISEIHSQGVANPPEHDFIVKSREYASAHGTSFLEATLAVAAKDTALYSAYRTSITGAESDGPKARSNNADRHTFMQRVGEYAAENRVDIADASIAVAANDPDLYASYRRSFHGEREASDSAKDAAAEVLAGHPFLVQAREYQKESGATFEEASVHVAGKEPRLYESYRVWLTRRA